MGKSLHRFPSLGLKSRIDAGSSPSLSTRSITRCRRALPQMFVWGGLKQVRQWRLKRMLMRPEAAFPYVFAAEGAQHPPNKPPRSTTLAATPAPPHSTKKPASTSLKAGNLYAIYPRQAGPGRICFIVFL